LPPRVHIDAARTTIVALLTQKWDLSCEGL